MIARRDGVLGGLFACAALLAPPWAGAQTAPRLRRIGVLAPDVSDGQGIVWEAFVDELARRGHLEGRHIAFEMRLGEADRPDLVDRLAAELVARKVDVIYAARGSMSALAAKKATATIPIVFFSSGDPVGLGLVASLARPGGNVTGTSVIGLDVVAKGLELFFQAAGGPRRIAYLQPTGSKSMPWFAGLEATLNAAAAALRSRVEFVEIASVVDIEPTIKRLVRDRFDAAIMSDFPLFRPHLDRIAGLLIEHRLPGYGNAHSGFLLHYGEQRLRLARMAAAYVDQILRGARPADLPVEQISTFELVINMKTAGALGLVIPNAVLVLADELIR